LFVQELTTRQTNIRKQTIQY